MRATVLLAALLAPAADDDPEPKISKAQALLLELTLPRLGVRPAGKAKPEAPDLGQTDLEKYADRGDPKSKARRACREAQALLWAVSPEEPPAGLRPEVRALRKKLEVDPGRLKLRYLVPADAKAEERLKDELFATSKQMSRWITHLEEALAMLDGAAEQREKECPRLKARLDLMRLWVLLRMVSLEEQQWALGLLRKELPVHDAARHKVIRLTAEDRLNDSAGRKLYKSAAKLAQQIRKEHPGTAWAKLAERALKARLGASWEAAP